MSGNLNNNGMFEQEARAFKAGKAYLLRVEGVPVGYTMDADWAIRWENQMHDRSVKVVHEIAPSFS